MDAVALIRKDHRTVDQLFTRYERTKGAAGKRRLADRIIRELSIHSAIEEQLAYPALRRRVQAREPQVLVALEEHHVVKLALAELEGMSPGDERFDAKMHVLIENVRSHVQEEERELLPALRRALSAGDLRDLGGSLAQAKKIAPTRPHPAAPDEPPGNLVAGVAASALDRSRDAVSRGVERAIERGRGVVGEALRRGERAAQRARHRLSRGLERAADEMAPEGASR